MGEVCYGRKREFQIYIGQNESALYLSSQLLAQICGIKWHGAQINFEDLTPYLIYVYSVHCTESSIMYSCVPFLDLFINYNVCEQDLRRLPHGVGLAWGDLRNQQPQGHLKNATNLKGSYEKIPATSRGHLKMASTSKGHLKKMPRTPRVLWSEIGKLRVIRWNNSSKNLTQSVNVLVKIK